MSPLFSSYAAFCQFVPPRTPGLISCPVLEMLWLLTGRGRPAEVKTFCPVLFDEGRLPSGIFPWLCQGRNKTHFGSPSRSPDVSCR